MSKSVDLRTCNVGEQFWESRNPFTGELIPFWIDQGLTESEKSAVRQLLAEVGASAPDPDGYCTFVLPRGSKMNVLVSDALNTADRCIAFELEYHSLSEEVAAFIHTFAVRGNMAIRGLDAVAVPLVAQRDRVISRWPTVQVTETPKELEDWLRHNVV